MLAIRLHALYASVRKQKKKKMGNVLSIHAEIFLKKNSKGNKLTPIKVASKLLKTLCGNSYQSFPIIIKQCWNWGNPSYRISYTDEYEPRSLMKFFEKNHESVEKIFARTFDEMGDWDCMISFPNDACNYKDMKRICRYSFDKIKYKSESVSNYEDAEIGGTFNAISDITLQDDRNLVNIPIEYLSSLKTFSMLEIHSNEMLKLENIIQKSKHVIFIDKGITVHQKMEVNEYENMGYQRNPSKFMAEKYNNSMYDIFSSGWSNCADEEYLSYKSQLKEESDSKSSVGSD